MKRTFISILSFIILSTFCFGKSQPVTEEDKTFQKIITFEGMSKNAIFYLANLWAVENFNDADSVIEYSNKEVGLISGKFIYHFKIDTYKGNWVDAAKCILQIEIKEGKRKTLLRREGSFSKYYHLRLRAASAFFLRFTLGFS